MQVSGDFSPLLRPGLRRDFRDSYQEFPVEWTGFLRSESTRQVEQSAVIMAGLPRFIEMGENDSITYEDPKMSRKVIGIDKEFGLGFQVSRRTMENDQYNKANQAAKWLAYSARMTYEYRAASFLDDAATGTYFKGVDNLCLLHVAHTTIASSQTFANTPATQYGFGLTGLIALQDLAQKQINETGDPLPVSPDTLVIGNDAEIQNRALQIYHSEKEPFTNENQDNAVKMRLSMAGTKPPMISHYKASSKSYFLIDSRLNDAHLFVFRPVDFDDNFDFQTKAAQYSSTTRFGIWYVSPIGWYGTTPT